MAQVTVTIDGKAYRMACEEGQEDHLTELANRFDQYVNHLKAQFGEIGDLRLTVMAGIMVMDELSEVNRKLKNLQTETDTLKQGRAATLSDQQKNEEVLASALSEVTTQIHEIAAKLSGKAAPAVN
ncbi:cell division protein ZapA [Pararhizobium sp. BT-229]|uniref:cell division protein ZapA n=1 Tax=Pararhizobium sp. BT-229 TaxID=2986923 RepID=UPI0021F7C0C3|nr:cell division protein ZapA [Pararhizobium sp. BT-229]MCV9966412.1 cell division protein ZapA [Pararhizobium sp. BT-229]